jgi:hypothetical protein
MANKSNQNQGEKIRIVLELQPDLYEEFIKSKFRTQANTDSEGIRSCIRFSLDSEQSTQLNNESQEKSDKEAAA